ncbi:hypothetical protein LEMLEM_LOCUS16249 [Lemmus lemmus]
MVKYGQTGTPRPRSFRMDGDSCSSDTLMGNLEPGTAKLKNIAKPSPLPSQPESATEQLVIQATLIMANALVFLNLEGLSQLPPNEHNAGYESVITALTTTQIVLSYYHTLCVTFLICKPSLPLPPWNEIMVNDLFLKKSLHSSMYLFGV